VKVLMDDSEELLNCDRVLVEVLQHSCTNVVHLSNPTDNPNQSMKICYVLVTR